MSDKYGILCRLPLTCACGHVGRGDGCYMRWCAACSDAICPDCFVDGQESLPRCRKCIGENRRTRLEIAGERMAMKREIAILNNITHG